MRTLPVIAGLMMLGMAPCLSANITARDWGTTAKGETVRLFTLKGAKGLEAHITNYGGVIVDLLVPVKGGKKIDVMLGYDDFKSYEKGGVYGAIIGRYVGRISHGGSFPIRVQNAGLVAAVTVSGLPQRADHELVVEALCLELNQGYSALRLD